VYSSSLHDNWDAFAVVEEMTFYDEHYCEGVDPELFSYSKFWGESYFVEINGDTVKRNYFIS